MKRKLLLFFLLILLLTISAHAAGTVRLDDLGMSLSIPEGYTVITRNMAPDDPALAIFDMDSDGVTKLLEDGDIYLDLMNEDPDFEFSVTSVPNEVKSMARFDDETLDSMEDTLKEQYQSAGLTVREVEHLFNGQAVFSRSLVSGEQGSEQIQLLRYYTVHNYHAIDLTLQYWGAEIPEKYQTLAQDILYSVQFDEPDVYTPSEEDETTSEADASEAETASGPIEQMLAKPAAADEIETPAPAPVRKKAFPIVPVSLAAAAVAAATVAVCLVSVRRRRAKQSANAVSAASEKPKNPASRARHVK